MPRPKIPVEDRLEIMELFAYYAWALNTGDAEAIMECFTPDGSMEHQPQGIFHGQDIRKLWDHLWYAKPGWFIGRQHLANHFVMTPLGPDEMHVKITPPSAEELAALCARLRVAQVKWAEAGATVKPVLTMAVR